MAYNKHTWTMQELITSDKLNNLELNAASGNSLINFVTKYDADNTGTNSISSLLQSALNETASLGLQLYIPTGTYKLDSTITLVNNMNLILSPSAKMVRYHEAGYTFHAKNGAGIGSGGKNIRISGGMWDTSDGFNNAHGLSLMHVSNSVFENMTFNNAVLSGHVFDLMGSRDITIRNNVFIGSNSTANRFFTEAIQIDEATAIGSSYSYSNESYDGLACDNISIVNNKCLPIMNGDDISYYSAPLVGMHAQVENNQNKNINIYGNYIQDTRPLPSADQVMNYGSIHIRNVDGVNIKNNVFKQTVTNEYPNFAISVLIGETYLKLSDVASNNPVFQNGATEDVSNIEISSNIFSGFKYNNLPSSGNPSIIQINGSSNFSKYINNVTVQSNKFYDSVRSGDENIYSNIVTNVISGHHVNNLIFNNNNIYDCNNLCDFSNINLLSVTNNNSYRLSNTIAKLNTLSGVFNNNVINGVHGNIYVDKSNIIISGNNVFNWTKHTGTVVYYSMISIRDPEAIVQNNRFIASGDIDNAVYVQPSGTKNKIITNNIFSGINSDKPTSIVYNNNINTLSK